MPRAYKKTKVIYRPLGKERAHGLADITRNTIELDTRLEGYRHLLYILHEHFHIKHPDWSETKVRKESSKTARFLWDNDFRWVEIK
jgi:hypothetical protein